MAQVVRASVPPSYCACQARCGLTQMCTASVDSLTLVWLLSWQDEAVVHNELPVLSENEYNLANVGPHTSKPASKTVSRVSSPAKAKKPKFDKENEANVLVVEPTVPSVPDCLTVNEQVSVPVAGPGESYENPDHLCRCCRHKGRMLRLGLW